MRTSVVRLCTRDEVMVARLCAFAQVCRGQVHGVQVHTIVRVRECACTSWHNVIRVCVCVCVCYACNTELSGAHAWCSRAGGAAFLQRLHVRVGDAPEPDVAQRDARAPPHPRLLGPARRRRRGYVSLASWAQRYGRRYVGVGVNQRRRVKSTGTLAWRRARPLY